MPRSGIGLSDLLGRGQSARSRLARLYDSAAKRGALPMAVLEIRCIHASVSSRLAQRWCQSEATARLLVERALPVNSKPWEAAQRACQFRGPTPELSRAAKRRRLE